MERQMFEIWAVDCRRTPLGRLAGPMDWEDASREFERYDNVAILDDHGEVMTWKYDGDL